MKCGILTPMAKYEVVVVTWHDAHAESAWMSIGDIDEDPFVVESVGWLIPNAKPNHTVIAQSIGVDEAVDGVLSIPSGMVVKIQTLTPTLSHVSEGYPTVA